MLDTALCPCTCCLTRQFVRPTCHITVLLRGRRAEYTILTPQLANLWELAVEHFGAAACSDGISLKSIDIYSGALGVAGAKALAPALRDSGSLIASGTGFGAEECVCLVTLYNEALDASKNGSK